MFSVVLPTYNRAGIVVDAVRSVLAQTYVDFELIIVDDRSTDDTQAVLAEINDPRVTVVTNCRSKGTAGARNMGILLARGPWVCQIDSDDLWSPDMLQRLAEAIANAPADTGIVYGSLAYLDRGTGRVTRIRTAEGSGNVHTQFLENHFIHHCSAAMRTSVLRDIGGYDEAFRSKVDSDLLLRMTERCTVLPVPEAVYVYRTGGDDELSVGKSHLNQFVMSYEQYLRKHEALFAREPSALYRTLTTILVLSIRAGDWSRAGRTWLRLVPSMWKAPRVFLREHKRLGSHATYWAKARAARTLSALGLRRSHA